MKNKYSPFLICTGFLLIMVGFFEFMALRKTDGHFCYPLDDTFIHMGVAKNVVLHGVWGISKFEWVSTSSSPLFTSLLALSFALFGISIIVPFIFSLVGGILIIFALNKELNEHSILSPKQKIWCILLTLIVAVIPQISLLGMEHTLQIAVALFFIHAAASYLTNQSSSTPSMWMLAGLGALMVSIRYESVFMVIAVCGILLLQKKIKSSLVIGFISILPIILFGLYLYLKGGFPIPNSVLLKGNNRYSTFLPGYDALSSLSGSLGGLLIIACILAFNKLQKSLYDRDFYLLGIFIITTLFHSLFGKFGWYFRYEAYLIVFGAYLLVKILMQSFNWREWRKPANLIIGSFFLILCINLGFRVLNALYRSSGAIHNIYDQQYQMGKFVQQNYNEDVVAANDVGAISYFSDAKILDLVGLASNEVTRAKLKNQYSPEFLRDAVERNKVKIAMVFDLWFSDSLTSNWHKVATWRLPYNVICGDDLVTFYSVAEGDADGLKRNLENFQKQHLPAEVKVEYFR